MAPQLKDEKRRKEKREGEKKKEIKEESERINKNKSVWDNFI